MVKQSQKKVSMNLRLYHTKQPLAHMTSLALCPALVLLTDECFCVYFITLRTYQVLLSVTTAL